MKMKLHKYTRSPLIVWSLFHMQEVIAEGYSASQTLSQLHSRLVSMDNLTDKQKSIIAEKMGVSLQPCLCVFVANVTIEDSVLILATSVDYVQDMRIRNFVHDSNMFMYFACESWLCVCADCG